MQGFTHLLAQFDGHGAVRRFAEVPESCPVCAYYVNPRPLSAHLALSPHRPVYYANGTSPPAGSGTRTSSR